MKSAASARQVGVGAYTATDTAKKYDCMYIMITMATAGRVDGRVKKKLYQYCNNRSLKRLMLLIVDQNSSLLKLRSRLLSRLAQHLSSTRFLFYTDELQPLEPAAECSYLVGVVYKSSNIVICILSTELEGTLASS